MKKGGFGRNQAKNEPHFLLIKEAKKVVYGWKHRSNV
jgi:hypothetical protein